VAKKGVLEMSYISVDAGHFSSNVMKIHGKCGERAARQP
jgi:hypothetical protein